MKSVFTVFMFNFTCFIPDSLHSTHGFLHFQMLFAILFPFFGNLSLKIRQIEIQNVTSVSEKQSEIELNHDNLNVVKHERMTNINETIGNR